MKLFDARGRLFGRVNLLDLLIVLALVAALVFGVPRLLGGQSGGGGAPGLKLTYTVRVNTVDKTIFGAVSRFVDRDLDKSDQLMLLGALVDGRVVDAYAVPHMNYSMDSTGIVRVSEEQGEDARLDVFFVIESTVQNTTTRQIGDQEIRTGRAYLVRTAHFELMGAIVSVDVGS